MKKNTLFKIGVFFYRPCGNIGFSCIIKSKQMGNLGCEDMKKRTIFDIEKVGFGDEPIVRPKAPNPSKASDDLMMNSVPKKTSSPKSTEIVPQSISHVTKKPPLQPKKVLLEEDQSSKKLVSGTQHSRFKPVEFVSPITGRREKQPKVVLLAHGQYELSTASLIEEGPEKLEDLFHDFEDEVSKYEDQVMGSIDFKESVLTEEDASLEQLPLEVEGGQQEVCPCHSIESHDDALEDNEAEVVSGLPDERIVEQEEVLVTTLPTHEAHIEEVDSKQNQEVLSQSILTSDEPIREDEELSLSEQHKEAHGALSEVSKEVREPLENIIESFEDENFCDEVVAQVEVDEEPVTYYETPLLSLLSEPELEQVADEEWVLNKMSILEQTFSDFGVKVKLTGDYTQGPTVTQIEIQPESGTKVSKILGLYNDLKLNLSVEELRIEPITGKNIIGVEIPNPKRKMVRLKEILSNPEFVLHESPLYIGLGQDIAGDPVYADILTMPHGLIAGQTGSGKSVCINTLLISILYKASPEDVRIMLIDPKRVELAPYNQIPHLVTPVIVDERKAAMGLKWAVDEMERRYELFAQNGVRDIKSFNERRHEFEMAYPKLPYLLIVIDELADLMMVSAQEVEDHIMRITQKARAAGIHLIVATQRPTVDVITGTIKSNIPSRIAFAVAQGNDSRVILDEMGAQTLLGKGDMLLSQSGSKLKRVQGAFISSEEIDAVVDFVKTQGKPTYLIEDQVFEKGSNGVKTDSDPLIKDAMRFFFDKGCATVSSLQTRMSIGYNRAARIVDTLEMNGWISQPQSSTKQREILITREEFESMVDETRF